MGSGRSGIVYLAYHLELEEYRAVKIVPKSISDYDTFRKEALFLKTLKHPGIPLVYDVLEDRENSYLIEEFLEGESLYALVKRLGALSAELTVHIGIQVCRIIQFMNSSENPILYLDLQPKNLLVCGSVVRLTDFDHAQFAKDVRSFGERYGTIGFAAPEQYLGEPLDCRTDVYAIGALLYYMRRGFPPGERPEFREDRTDGGLWRVIRSAMADKKEERLQSAAELLEALTELPFSQPQQADQNQKNQAIQSQIILFAGARSGIGTTHGALGMAGYLARNGFSCLYQEVRNVETIRKLANSMGRRPDRFGIYHIGRLHIRPYYGEAVRFPYLYYPIILKDAGTSWQEAEWVPEADLTVLVCGGKWWEIDETVAAARTLMKRGPLVLLFNHMGRGFRMRLPKDLLDLPIFYLPYFPNPFELSEAAVSCFRSLLKEGEWAEGLWKEKREGRRSWPRTRRKKT